MLRIGKYKQTGFLQITIGTTVCELKVEGHTTGRKLIFALLTLAGLLAFEVALLVSDALLWKKEGKSPLYALLILGADIAVITVGIWLFRLISKRIGGIRLRLTQFIFLLVPERDREHLLGDLEEEFLALLPEHGAARAHFYYWWEATISVIPYIVRFVRRALGAAASYRLIRK